MIHDTNVKLGGFYLAARYSLILVGSKYCTRPPMPLKLTLHVGKAVLGKILIVYPLDYFSEWIFIKLTNKIKLRYNLGGGTIPATLPYTRSRLVWRKSTAIYTDAH